jgi:hypothetical protein
MANGRPKDELLLAENGKMTHHFVEFRSSLGFLLEPVGVTKSAYSYQEKNIEDQA